MPRRPRSGRLEGRRSGVSGRHCREGRDRARECWFNTVRENRTLLPTKTALGGLAMTRIRFGIITALAVCGLAIPQAVRAAPEAAKGPEEVNFAVSCGPEAQKAFSHAVWTLHSFWYPEALKAFT